MVDEPQFIVAIAWFERGDWDEIKRLCADELHDSYDQWLTDAEEVVASKLGEGFTCEKVVLKPEDIHKRQRVLGRKVNGQDRARLAVVKLQKADRVKERRRLK